MHAAQLKTCAAERKIDNFGFAAADSRRDRIVTSLNFSFFPIVPAKFELHFEGVSAPAFNYQPMQALAKLPNRNNFGAIALRAGYRRFISGFNK
jgi:hypothetical protein